MNRRKRVEIRTIEVGESIFDDANAKADEIRKMLAEKKVYMLNVMSSPGSGKTTLLAALINMLKSEYEIGLMNVDIETATDAETVATKTGVNTLQIHNGGLCHVDSNMTYEAIEKFGVDGYDILFLENIGNLVCPAEFDTGANKNVMILSVPEGDDKPLKYPLMFSVSDLIIISKTDTLEIFDFDMETACRRIRKLNPNAEIIAVSAKTGEGMDKLAEWVRCRVVGK